MSPKSLIRRDTLWGYLAALVLLTSITTFWSAFELANTVDENVYVKAGLDYLNTLSFTYNHEHPPLSKWLGALPAWILGSQELGWFRVAHVVLFLVGGLFFVGSLSAWGGVVAGLFFALLYFFDPNIKSMAALHINDFDVALFIGLSAFCAWRLWLEFELKISLVFWSVFFFILAINSKFSALFYTPFLFLALYLRLREFHKRSFRSFPRKLYWAILAALALGFLFSYLFQLTEIHWYGKGIDAQRLHNRAQTHPAFLWGEISLTGFWDFYILSLWTKLPLGHWIAWLASWLLCWRLERQKLLPMLVLFFLPALFLLIHLSSLNVQTGLRYFLPGVLLLHLFAVLVCTEHLGLLLSGRYKAYLSGFVLSLFVLPDVWTFYHHSYLSYFNFWAPKPTRNFADSNVDWRQGLPPRVSRKLPNHLLWSDFRPSNFVAGQPVRVLIGARDLSGMVSLRGPLMRAFEPQTVIGGYEFHELSYAEAVRLFHYPIESPAVALKTVGEFSAYLKRCVDNPLESLEKTGVDPCLQRPE